MERTEKVKNEQIDRFTYLSVRVFVSGLLIFLAGIALFILGRFEHDSSIQFGGALSVMGGGFSIAAAFYLRIMIRRRSLSTMTVSDQDQVDISEIDKRKLSIWYLMIRFAMMIGLPGIVIILLLPNAYGIIFATVAIVPAVIMLVIAYLSGRKISADVKRKMIPSLLRQSIVSLGVFGLFFIFAFWNIRGFVTGSILCLAAIIAGSISYSKGR
ncbi:MAG: hypothetical protein ACYC0L_02235 [Thermoleophilia bacterium]